MEVFSAVYSKFDQKLSILEYDFFTASELKNSIFLIIEWESKILANTCDSCLPEWCPHCIRDPFTRSNQVQEIEDISDKSSSKNTKEMKWLDDDITIRKEEVKEESDEDIGEYEDLGCEEEGELDQKDKESKAYESKAYANMVKFYSEYSRFDLAKPRKRHPMESYTPGKSSPRSVKTISPSKVISRVRSNDSLSGVDNISKKDYEEWGKKIKTSKSEEEGLKNLGLNKEIEIRRKREELIIMFEKELKRLRKMDFKSLDDNIYALYIYKGNWRMAIKWLERNGKDL